MVLLLPIFNSSCSCLVNDDYERDRSGATIQHPSKLDSASELVQDPCPVGVDPRDKLGVEACRLADTNTWLTMRLGPSA